MKKDKNWLKEQINYFKEAVGKPAINDFSRGLNDAYDTLESLIDQLDEPEKVVIPQFVADWIEEHDHLADTSKIRVLWFAINKCDRSIGVYMLDYFNQNSRKVMRAILDGYTIEKEIMYYVILVESEDKEYGQALYKDFNFNGDKVVSTHIEPFSKRIALEAGNFHFTKQEIEAIDERYWAFAEEVDQ